MSARTETMQLYRQFLRLRYMFPNKQGRSTLRRWASMFFTMRQGEYERLLIEQGRTNAAKTAQVWRQQARQDLDMWKALASQNEEDKRQLLERIITYEKK